jgi:hypothetical protein
MTILSQSTSDCVIYIESHDKMRRNGSDPSQLELCPLFSENFLQLADFLLNFPTYLFDLAFGF